ncbi:polyprenyl diphosphate synthase [Mesorhizobium sp. VK24D]|uniref:Isoprenyl transferase n=1 Tax=Mesorhizobium album TaxID=3072314 RepID=A0ABU4XWV1_9HYPH|nr:polyprenyl diphosphate synthase [Mesorhizobium sp. VK24D]MDX8478911.1 polyprenyl diphosphate synthase [Mesorhizobium sp. VK24D]
MMRLLYWLYERLLRHQVRQHPAPHHVGIILDGNRRFARERGYSDPRAAYELGAEKLDDVLAWCIDLEIRAVTLWVFSIDNMRRPPAEVSAIMAAVEKKIAALAEDPSILSRGVRLRAAGRLDLLPVSTADVIREATERTAGNEALTVTIAIAYGGREEIVDAVRNLVRQKRQQGVDLDTILDELSPAAIDEYLYTAGLPDLDLIIRTSGEVRLSGFLLWQSASSELYFSDVNWPEFRKLDFLRAVRAYQRRRRRFGK